MSAVHDTSVNNKLRRPLREELPLNRIRNETGSIILIGFVEGAKEGTVKITGGKVELAKRLVCSGLIEELETTATSPPPMGSGGQPPAPRAAGSGKPGESKWQPVATQRFKKKEAEAPPQEGGGQAEVAPKRRACLAQGKLRKLVVTAEALWSQAPAV